MPSKKMTRKQLEALIQATIEEGRHELDWQAKYVEPGDRTPKRGVLLANWNHAALKPIAENAERFGYEIEWSDEWTTCEHCQGLLRTVSNSYCWRMFGKFWDGGEMCADCIRNDFAEEFLAWMEGKSHDAITFDLPLEQYGYEQYNGTYTSGLHIGQDDDPRKIASQLKALGVGRFLFTIPSVGQFDVDFELWVHESEMEQIYKPIDPHGYDPGLAMRRMLQASTAELRARDANL